MCEPKVEDHEVEILAAESRIIPGIGAGLSHPLSKQVRLRLGKCRIEGNLRKELALRIFRWIDRSGEAASNKGQGLAVRDDTPTGDELNSQLAGALNRDFVRTGPSLIDGTGVFAKRPIHRGARIIEYCGERVAHDQLLVPAGSSQPKTYVFRLDEATLIDGERGGNDSRFINHSCDPNCEAYAFDDRIYIYALADIPAGAELTFDYKLAPLARVRPKAALDEQSCLCGAANCRGTMRRTRRKRRTAN